MQWTTCKQFEWSSRSISFIMIQTNPWFHQAPVADLRKSHIPRMLPIHLQCSQHDRSVHSFRLLATRWWSLQGGPNAELCWATRDRGRHPTWWLRAWACGPPPRRVALCSLSYRSPSPRPPVPVLHKRFTFEHGPNTLELNRCHFILP